MYAIHSLLRRLAGTVVYVEEGRPCRFPPNTQQLHIPSMKWKPEQRVCVYELRAEAPTSALAAQKLSLRENEIAEAVKAKDRRYTLVLGPEVEEGGEGSVVRKTRIALINGIYRYRGGIVERLLVQGRDGRKARRRRKRSGVHREMR